MLYNVATSKITECLADDNIDGEMMSKAFCGRKITDIVHDMMENITFVQLKDLDLNSGHSKAEHTGQRRFAISIFPEVSSGWNN